MDALSNQLISFINDQSMFFVATAAPEGRVNVSPKGMDTLRVVSANRIVWLNLTGSGNETAAHVGSNGRMTLMFCSFGQMPMILRVYGTAGVTHPYDAGWPELVSHFPVLSGSRQIFDLRVELVQTSCGTGVPIMALDAVRADEELEPFYAEMTDDQLHDYWAKKNTTSIDGYPTHIFDNLQHDTAVESPDPG